MNRILRRSEFGDPILRQKARSLPKLEILSKDIQQLIDDMQYTLENKKYGIALAAPQVGKSISLIVIYIRPTILRPDLPNSKWATLVIINPKITKTFGQPRQYWEGCISLSNTFAKVPRYQKIVVNYMDEKAVKQEKAFEGLLAHVLQHEIDHFNGVLFVDKVEDSTTFVSAQEYKMRFAKTEAAEQYN